MWIDPTVIFVLVRVESHVGPLVSYGSYDLAELRYQSLGSGAFMIIKMAQLTLAPAGPRQLAFSLSLKA